MGMTQDKHGHWKWTVEPQKINIGLTEAVKMVGPGWWNLVHLFYQELRELYTEFRVTAVASQHGQLRVVFRVPSDANQVYTGHRTTLYQIEEMSRWLCETCGSPGFIHQSSLAPGTQLKARCRACARHTDLTPLNWMDDFGNHVTSVHRYSHECFTYGCSIHNPTETWGKQRWYYPEYRMVRVCKHGVEHPDIDHLHYLQRKNHLRDYEQQAKHTCDGCCEKHGRIFHVG